MFPLKASSNQRFSILRRRIMHAVECSDIDRSIILVFQSRAFLGLLTDQFKHLNVIAACEGESEAITALQKQRVGLMVAGDQLKEGHITSLGTRATKIQPNLRMMAILQDPISSHRYNQFHALIADADIGVDEFPVYQGLMAMITNKQYRSTGILELHTTLDLATNSNDSSVIQLTPREHDILRCYSMGLTNREAAQTLELSYYIVQTYSSDLLAKLGVKNRQKALLKAVAMGISKIAS
jgi:DNA-binding NarL/FixJ family response regulator